MSFNQLEDFASEGPLKGGEAPISVHDVVARGTPVSWDEAVAIVEEMCAVAIARSGDEAPVPALADILLAANGSVAISRGHGEDSPTAAGRALHAVLANADVPVPLRLFVTQSAAPGTHRSLQEFAAGLAYFGRPNRTALIQEVYKRAAALVRAGVQPTLSPPPLPVQEKEPSKKPSKKSPESKRLNPRRTLLWAGAVVFVAAAATGAWAWRSAGSRGTATAGHGVLSQASAALTDLANQVRDRLKPAAPVDAQVPSVTSSADSRPRPRRRTAPPSVMEEAPLVSRHLSIAEQSAWQVPFAVPATAMPVPVAAPVSVAAPETVGPVEEPESADAERVFTKQDADVSPPVLGYPQLTPPLKKGSSRATPVNSVEVVVAPDGSVERIRFVEGPVRMMDIMLVASVKNWKFAPALKDGEPVRYQTVVSWLAVP